MREKPDSVKAVDYIQLTAEEIERREMEGVLRRQLVKDAAKRDMQRRAKEIRESMPQLFWSMVMVGVGLVLLGVWRPW